MRASVCASSVLPQPVGPISRMFDFASSTSLFLVGVVEALVVVVDGDREHALGVVLADHVVVENLADLLRRRNAVARLHQRGLVLLADDVHAQFDAFIADEHGRAGDQLADLVLALAAERAVEGVLGVAAADLAHPSLRHRSAAGTPSRRPSRLAASTDPSRSIDLSRSARIRCNSILTHTQHAVFRDSFKSST